jgi:hypothetical protein
VPANLETRCLPEIDDISRKLRLRCGFQFPWCAIALKMHLAESNWFILLVPSVTDMRLIIFTSLFDLHASVVRNVIRFSETIIEICAFRIQSDIHVHNSDPMNTLTYISFEHFPIVHFHGLQSTVRHLKHAFYRGLPQSTPRYFTDNVQRFFLYFLAFVTCKRKTCVQVEV